jgi:hypothetical protein
MSYRTDAEVADCAYGCTYSKLSKKNVAAAATNMNTFTSLTRSQYETRTGSALWFVSNCGANLRVNFALGLGKHYPVKIYGNCEHRIEFMRRQRPFYHNYYAFLAMKYIGSVASLLFGGSKSRDDNEAKFDQVTTSSRSCKRHSDCELHEFSTHRYYLSFESKNCSNYITEKLWLILRTHMIPIVMQPSKEFYELNAPRNSFIHLQDFDFDYERLAGHLRALDQDFVMYFQYHAWRLEVDVAYSGRQTERRRFCQMCTRLNTESASIYYTKVADWYNQNCVIN